MAARLWAWVAGDAAAARFVVPPLLAEVFARTYQPTADDLTCCAGCGQACQPYPHRASLFCAVCAAAVLEGRMPTTLLADVQAQRLALRAALLAVAPTTLHAIEQSFERAFERRAIEAERCVPRQTADALATMRGERR